MKQRHIKLIKKEIVPLSCRTELQRPEKNYSLYSVIDKNIFKREVEDEFD